MGRQRLNTCPHMLRIPALKPTFSQGPRFYGPGAYSVRLHVTQTAFPYVLEIACVFSDSSAEKQNVHIHCLETWCDGEDQPEKSGSRTAMTLTMSACQPWEHAHQDGYLRGLTVYFL